jgi:hypothetical protein
VKTAHRNPLVRRYLLGEATDEECEALERDYFENETALGRVESEEEALIEEYLAGRLNAREHDFFERRYLASPAHRQRVETIRRLLANHPTVLPGSLTDGRTGRFRYQWVALAAALILAVGALWIIPRKPAIPAGQRSSDTRSPDTSTPTQTPPGPLPAPPAPRRVFAFSLRPIQTRGADDVPRLVIPNGTDVVALQLEGTNDRAGLDPMRVEIRTVNGQAVWKGSAAGAVAPRSGILARVDVPAAALPADDYIVVLFEIGSGGSERQRDNYFLRVR